MASTDAHRAVLSVVDLVTVSVPGAPAKMAVDGVCCLPESCAVSPHSRGHILEDPHL